MEVGFKILHKDAKVPVKATAGSAAYDVWAVSACRKRSKFNDNMFIEFDLGFALELPINSYCLFLPRSSVSEHGLIFCNSPGLGDSDYRGPMKVRFYDFGGSFQLGDFDYSKAIAQLMVCEGNPDIDFQQKDKLSETVRGAGGFGSTDKDKV